MATDSYNGSSSARRYFVVERFLLKISGMSLDDDESIYYKIYSLLVLIIFHYIYPCLLLVDITKLTFEETVNNWLYVIATILAASVSTVTYIGRKTLGRVLRKLENEPFTSNAKRGDKEEEDKYIQKWLFSAHAQGMAFLVLLILALFGQMVYSLVKRIISSDYHDWSTGFADITVINTTYSPNYEIFWTFQNATLIYMSSTLASTTLIIAGVLSNVKVHFQILQNYLKRMVEISSQQMLKNHTLTETDDQYIEMQWTYLKRHVENAISYHLNITNISEEIENLFSEAILLVYMCSLAMLCLEGYRASLLPLNDVKTFRILIEGVGAFFHAMLICYNAEQMTHESLEVGTAAFHSNFVGTDLRFQKDLIIIIRRTQNPIKIKAGKMIESSLHTLVWIVQTSFSAYMMLRTLNAK